jgi:hypothetical protein
MLRLDSSLDFIHRVVDQLFPSASSISERLPYFLPSSPVYSIPRPIWIQSQLVSLIDLVDAGRSV